MIHSRHAVSGRGFVPLGLELELPAMMNPPSRVCWIELAHREQLWQKFPTSVVSDGANSIQQTREWRFIIAGSSSSQSKWKQILSRLRQWRPVDHFKLSPDTLPPHSFGHCRSQPKASALALPP